MSESDNKPQLPPGWPKDVFPPPPDAEDGEAVLGPTVEGYTTDELESEIAKRAGERPGGGGFLGSLGEMNKRLERLERLRIEHLQHPEVEIVSEEEVARQTRRDLQERVFVALLVGSYLVPEETGSSKDLQDFFEAVWDAAQIAVRARP